METIKIDPPEVFQVHYTELTKYQPFLEREPEWAVLFSRLPQLLAAGHQGCYAVVEGDRITVVPTSLQAIRLRDELPYGQARYYPIHEFYPLGRRVPRLRKCPDSSSQLPQTA